MGFSLSLVLASIFMVQCEKTIFSKDINNPKLQLKRVDDTFVIWSHDKDSLQEFMNCLNKEEKSIKFTMEIENNLNYFTISK